VIQEERSAFWEVIEPVIVRRSSYERVQFWMVSEIGLFEYPGFCLRGWMKNDVYRRKVDSWDESLARILDATASIKTREDQLRWTTRDLHTWIAKCTEVAGGIFEHLLWTLTNLSVRLEIQIKTQLTVSNFSFFFVIHNAFVSVDSTSSISVAIQN
jgi:hypothetical protein